MSALQRQHRLDALSWEEKQTGPSNEALWTMTCKSTSISDSQRPQFYIYCFIVDGQVMGSATAGNKAVAKDKAATQALQKLGVTS